MEEELLLTIAERAEEKILMGLRLTQEGAPFARLRPDERNYLEQLWKDGRVERLTKLGLLEATPEALYATPQGQLLLNRVIAELLN